MWDLSVHSERRWVEHGPRRQGAHKHTHSLTQSSKTECERRRGKDPTERMMQPEWNFSAGTHAALTQTCRTKTHTHTSFFFCSKLNLVLLPHFLKIKINKYIFFCIQQPVTYNFLKKKDPFMLLASWLSGLTENDKPNELFCSKSACLTDSGERAIISKVREFERTITPFMTCTDYSPHLQHKASAVWVNLNKITVGHYTTSLLIWFQSYSIVNIQINFCSIDGLIKWFNSQSISFHWVSSVLCKLRKPYERV